MKKAKLLFFFFGIVLLEELVIEILE